MNLNKKLIVSLVAAVILIVAGIGAYFIFGKGGGFFGPSFKNYTNQDFKFSLDYPADWTIIDASATQNDSQFRGVAIEGPMRYDLPGYEQSGVRYLLVLEFKDSFVTDDVTVQFTGFARKKEAGETRPTLAKVADVEKTAEYKVAQKIIESVKFLP